MVQTAWLLLGLVLGGPIVYVGAVHVVPDVARGLGLAPCLLAAPFLYFAGVGVYTVAAATFAVLVKWVLIGRYRSLRATVWGSFYIRNWMVKQAVRLVPWQVLEGTVFPHVVLRTLGARIGRRVHLHRGVGFLQGGWDLLDIGDDVTISRDAVLQLVDLEDGQIVVGPITVGSGSTLDVRAALGPNTRMEPDAYLTAHSFLSPGDAVPQGEKWAGVPAAPAGDAPPVPVADGGRELSPGWHGVAMLLGRMALSASSALTLAVLALAFAWVKGIDAEQAVEWVLHPSLDAGDFFLSSAIIILLVPLSLVSQCLSMRALGASPRE